MRVGILDDQPLYVLGLCTALQDRAVVTCWSSEPDYSEWRAQDVMIVNHRLLHSPTLTRSSALGGLVGLVVLCDDADRPAIVSLARHINRRCPVTTVTDVITSTAGRVRPPEPPDSGAETDPTLSAREYEVLELIVAGLTHAQIATRLAISPHTVDTYVKRLRSKLGGGNKADLIREALARGIAVL